MNMRVLTMIALTCATTMAGSGCSSEVDKIRIEFIDSCKQGGATTAVCKCAFDHLKRHYGEDGLISVQARQTPPADFFEVLSGAAQQCRTR